MSIFKINFDPEDIVDYLNQKYDDTFTLVKEISFSPALKGRKIMVHSEKYPEIDVLAIRFSNPDGDIDTDNYMHIKYRAQMIECVTGILEDLFGDAKKCVYYYPNNYTASDKGSDNMTFEDFVTNPPAIISIDTSVITDVGIVDQDVVENKLVELYKKNSYKFKLKIRVFDSSLENSDLDDSNYMDFIVSNQPTLIFNTEKYSR